MGRVQIHTAESGYLLQGGLAAADHTADPDAAQILTKSQTHVEKIQPSLASCPALIYHG